MKTIKRQPKITLATLKKFIRENKQNLFLKRKSDFSGMTDGIEIIREDFSPITLTDSNLENTLGIQGVWVVGGSRNYFTPFVEGNYVGIDVYNCCGSFLLTTKIQ
ncbi:MAG TPA: hypothetical protein PKL13_04435 [bacterium]|jgi:hypothetical protein|nr:hypothetical protein [bacterium]